jgi:hypothetical protein
MRNFSATVRNDELRFIDVERFGFTSTEFINCQHQLMAAMEANPNAMSPSEEAVLADFIGWAKGLHLQYHSTAPGEVVRFVNPAFIYVNVNTGAKSVFVSVFDGKLRVAGDYRSYWFDNVG